MSKQNEQRLFPADFTEQYQLTQVIEKSYEHHDVQESVGELPKKLVVRMEAIHVGRTKNYTFYTKEGLSDGLESWTNPYNKPVLTHHNDYDGEPIGRIISAQFYDVTASGRPGLVFTAEITDKQAIPKVLDGRYTTVSIGASTDRVTCNICGTDRTKEFCEHVRGESYEDLTCHYIIGKTIGREVSYVNVPADEFAGNVSVAIAESAENIHHSDLKTVTNEGGSFMDDLQTETANAQEPVQEPIVESEKEPSILEESVEPSVEEQVTVNITDEETKKVQETNELTAVKQQEDQEKIKALELQVELLSRELSLVQHEQSQLVSQMKRLVAERVVEMKRALHKPDVLAVSVEEAINAYAEKRSLDSLKDSLEDLKVESQMALRSHLSIENPAAPIQEKEKKTTVSEALDILNNMFKSKKGGF